MNFVDKSFDELGCGFCNFQLPKVAGIMVFLLQGNVGWPCEDEGNQNGMVMKFPLVVFSDHI